MFMYFSNTIRFLSCTEQLHEYPFKYSVHTIYKHVLIASNYYNEAKITLYPSTLYPIMNESEILLFLITAL